MNCQETTACKYCGKPTLMLGTKLCDGCWELESRIEANPELARKIMEKLGQPLPPRRPATKIEVEAVSAIAKLQDDIHEARQIIRGLLGVFPRHVFPEKHNKAKQFLTKENDEIFSI